MEKSQESADRPSRDEFAQSLMQAISSQDSSVKLTYNVREFCLHDHSGNRQTNLANMYEEHCQLRPEQRPEHIRMLVSIFFDVTEENSEQYEEARIHLRPKIWNRSTFEELELQRRIRGTGKPCDIPLYPVGSHLYSSIVYDLPTAMRSVSMEELDRWGVSIYQALEDATQNLLEIEMSVGKIGDGFYMSACGDNYDSARLLLTDRIQSLNVPGDHIAMVPQRDALFIAGSDDPESLKIMLDLTAQIVHSQPRPLAPVPLRLSGNEWVDWLPPQNHPLYSRFAELRNDYLGSLYESQKELLTQLYRNEGENVFIASWSGIRRKAEERIMSYCVWGEGVDALLPETDLVMLPTAESLGGMGYWNHVREVAGALIQRVPELYPPRYRVREFPSQAQLEEIGMLDFHKQE